MDLSIVSLIKNLKSILLWLGFMTLAACASKPQEQNLKSLPVGTLTETRQLPPNFIWPVIGGIITRGYKTPHKGIEHKHSRRWRMRHIHHGVDVAARRGTPIYAAHSGRVSHVGRDRLGYRGYGKLVVIKSKNRQWKTYYAHLDKFKVKYGQKINKGQIIGLMGNTGRSRGTHLHFEIRKANNPIDPIEYLPYSSMITWQYSQPPLWQSEVSRATP